MSLRKIYAIVLQEIYITRHSFEVIMDLGFFSLVSTIVFGFVAVWLAGSASRESALYLLIGLNFWNIVTVVSYSVAVGSLWNIWSRSLNTLFVSPISMKEYMMAHVISAAIKAFIIVGTTLLITSALFKFNMFSLGWTNISLMFINLFIFACSVGFATLGLIFRFGTRIQALAWSIASLFQPLTAALYPVKVLPPALQSFAYLLPPTYVFEAAREYFKSGNIHWDLYGISFVVNILYLVISLAIFWVLFSQSKETGQFAKNES